MYDKSNLWKYQTVGYYKIPQVFEKFYSKK